MNLAKALVAPRKAELALAERETRKSMSPSQPLGGIYIGPNALGTINTGTNPDTLIVQGWKANVWAYTCVDRLASAVAQAWWRVERKDGDDWEPDLDDWRTKLLAYPSADKLSGFELMYYWAAWLAIKGNGLLRKIPGGENGILELWPMSPKNLRPTPHPTEWISGYEIIEDGKWKPHVPAEEVIHARLTDPSDPLWGYGMLEAAFDDVLSDNASADWRKEMYENGGVPPAAITDDNLTSPEQLNEHAAAMHVAWRRNAKDHVPMLLGAGKNVLNFGFSASDMEIPEDRAMTRDTIVSAFGMLPAMFSNDAATFDNQDGAIRFMYENGAGRLLAVMRDALNLALLTREERESDSVYINFDLSQIPYFRRQRESRIAGMGAALKSGISRDDYVELAELGLEPAGEGGDTIFVEAGLVTLAESSRGMASNASASYNETPAGQPKPTDIAQPQLQDVQVTQDAVLNGAQITAATAIVQAVAVGDLPRDAGIGQLMVLFNLDSAQAEQMMGSAGKSFVAQSTVAPPPSSNSNPFNPSKEGI